MDVISLALALKALKNSSGGEGGSDIDFIHEVDDLNITEAETGIYKVNKNFSSYLTHPTIPSQSGFSRVPNLDPNLNITTSVLVFISKSIRPTLNEIKWDWVLISNHNGSIRFGTTTKTTDPNTQEISYSGTSKLTENNFNKTGPSGITDDNKNSTTIYPSVKAVVDYVDDVLTDITETQY